MRAVEAPDRRKKKPARGGLRCRFSRRYGLLAQAFLHEGASSARRTSSGLLGLRVGVARLHLVLLGRRSWLDRHGLHERLALVALPSRRLPCCSSPILDCCLPIGALAALGSCRPWLRLWVVAKAEARQQRPTSRRQNGADQGLVSWGSPREVCLWGGQWLPQRGLKHDGPSASKLLLKRAGCVVVDTADKTRLPRFLRPDQLRGSAPRGRGQRFVRGVQPAHQHPDEGGLSKRLPAVRQLTAAPGVSGVKRDRGGRVASPRCPPSVHPFFRSPGWAPGRPFRRSRCRRRAWATQLAVAEHVRPRPAPGCGSCCPLRPCGTAHGHNRGNAATCARCTTSHSSTSPKPPKKSSERNSVETFGVEHAPAAARAAPAGWPRSRPESACANSSQVRRSAARGSWPVQRSHHRVRGSGAHASCAAWPPSGPGCTW